MNCTLKVARGLNYCWRKLPQPQHLPRQVRLLSHRPFDWRHWNPDPPSQLHSHLHRFDNPSMEEHMGQPMASSQRRGPVWEPGRRAIMQDPQEHQRRQQLIIEENKRRWSRGNAPGISKPDIIYDADNRRNQQQSRQRRKRKAAHKAAKDYSRKRRYQRVRELKRQEYELKKSRRGYNLPGSDRTRDESRGEDVTMSRHENENQTQYEQYGASEEWLRKREDAEEAKYWHSWHTCPSQRCDEDLESSGDLGRGPRRHPRGYYDSRRSFHHMQLPSIRSPDHQMMANRLVNRRRPMQKRTEEACLEEEPAVEKKRLVRLVKPPPIKSVMGVTRAAAPVCSFSEQLNIPSPSYDCAGRSCSSLSDKWRQYSSLQKGLRRGA
ncbi:uncharacterized protein LOC111075978 [Drosophila obscura]|uniref:uncharacterized protein LOC111075978 n=1 Tax=Drosophila obscura TaxID=7282 RepID=UPI001BB15AF5|nr:uncharacterized protein LOC111075978 [Drosophila obscura]